MRVTRKAVKLRNEVLDIESTTVEKIVGPLVQITLGILFFPVLMMNLITKDNSTNIMKLANILIEKAQADEYIIEIEFEDDDEEEVDEEDDTKE